MTEVKWKLILRKEHPKTQQGYGRQHHERVAVPGELEFKYVEANLSQRVRLRNDNMCVLLPVLGPRVECDFQFTSTRKHIRGGSNVVQDAGQAEA